MLLKILFFLLIIIYFGCEFSTEDLPLITEEKLLIPLTLDDYANFPFDDIFLISFEDTLGNSDENIWVTFDSVLSESRCPINVVCFWAGNAEILMLFSDNEYIQKIRLNTYFNFENEQNVLGYNISLIDVLPYPHQDSSYVDEDYSAKLIIKKWP